MPAPASGRAAAPVRCPVAAWSVFVRLPFFEYAGQRRCHDFPSEPRPDPFQISYAARVEIVVTQEAANPCGNGVDVGRGDDDPEPFGGCAG